MPGDRFENEVAIFEQLHKDGVLHKEGVPLYFIGNDLARATGGLPENLRSVWTGLLHLKPADTEVPENLVTVTEEKHPVMNGPFGVMSGFKLASDYDVSVATRAREKKCWRELGTRMCCWRTRRRRPASGP